MQYSLTDSDLNPGLISHYTLSLNFLIYRMESVMFTLSDVRIRDNKPNVKLCVWKKVGIQQVATVVIAIKLINIKAHLRLFIVSFLSILPLLAIL